MAFPSPGEREITAARCVVVVWTPRSFDREWVHLEAHHGRGRGILVPILIEVDQPPFAFSLIQARNFSGWDGSRKAVVAGQFLADVRHKLDGTSPQPSSSPPVGAAMGGEAGNNPDNLRSANRNRNQPDNRNNNIGFRVASTLIRRSRRDHGLAGCARGGVYWGQTRRV